MIGRDNCPIQPGFIFNPVFGPKFPDPVGGANDQKMSEKCQDQ